MEASWYIQHFPRDSVDKARSPSHRGSTIPVLPAMAVDLPRTGLVGWLVGWSLMYPLVN